MKPQPRTPKTAARTRGKSPPLGAGAKSVLRAMAQADAAEQNKALTDILRVISSSPADLQPVFDTILSHAIRLCQGSAAVLWQYEGDALHFASSRRPGDNKPGSDAGSQYFRKNPLALGKYNPTPQAALEKRTVHVLDVFADRKYRPLIPKDSFRTLPNAGTVLAVPLLRQEELFGVVTIWRFEKRLFSDQQVAMVEAFAAQAALAIHNVRLHNETKEALEQQTATAEILRVISRSPDNIQPVFDSILENAMHLCDAGLGTVGLYDGKHYRHVAQRGGSAEYARWLFSEPFEPGPASTLGRMIATRQPFHTPDYRELAEYRERKPRAVATVELGGARTYLAVPMLKDGRAIGGITIRRAEVRPFTQRQIDLVSTFANQAVIAIENVRLFNETKEALEHQKASAEILRIVAASVESTQPVFDAITAAGVRLIPGSRVALMLVRDGKLDYTSHSGVSEERRAAMAKLFPMPLDESFVAGATVLGKRTIHIPDFQAERERYRRSVDVARVSGYRAMLSVPLIHAGDAIGVIAVSRETPGAFSDKQIALVRTFADQAAIAIENARLFNETKEALEQQTAAAEILKVISGSPTNIQPVLDAVAANAARLCEAVDAVIALRDADQFYFAAHYGPIPISGARRLSRATAAGRAILEGRQIHIQDLQAETGEFPEGSARAREFGYRTMLATPLMREGAAIGAILIRRTQARLFSDRHLALVRTFADQAVIAIENVRLFNETKEALERQTATSEVLRVISGTLADAQPVFNAIAQSAARVFNAPHIGVGLVEGGAIRLKATAGSIDPRGDMLIPFERSSTAGSSLLDKAIVDVPDTEAADALPFARTSGRVVGFRAIASAPMLREGKAVGVITVMRAQPGALTEKQRQLLQTFADQAVIAIENARLFNETKEALERQTATAEILRVISGSPTDIQPVLRAVAESAAHLCEASNVHIRLLEGDRMRVAMQIGDIPIHPDSSEQRVSDKSAPARAILERRTIHIHDILDPEVRAQYPDAVFLRVGDSFRTLLVVPLIREGEAIGTITARRAEVRPFSEQQITLLQMFAAQAVIAIENVRLFNETKEALERQTATSDVLGVISSSPTDVQPVFDTIADNALKLCEANAVVVSRFDGELIHIAAIRNIEPEASDTIRKAFPAQPSSRGATSRAIRDRAIVRIPDVRKDPGYSPTGLAEAANIRSLLAVPMLRGGNAVGAIAVSRGEPGTFPEHKVSLLKTFADQAAIAIENVRLFNETKEALEQQTAISEVLRVISSSPTDVKPVLDAVAARAARICEANDARIFLVEGDRFRHAAGFGDVPITTDIVPLNRGSPSGRAIIDRAPQHIEDMAVVSEEEFPVGRPLALRAGWRTVLSVPLMRENRALGAIALRRMEVRPFMEKQIRLLKTFADQAAIAIENVRLFNETKESLDQQRASADVLGVISSSIADTKPVFDKILDSCTRLFESYFVGIGVIQDDSLVHVAAYHGPRREEFESVFPVPVNDDSATGRAILSREVVHYPDVLGGADVPFYVRRSAEKIGGKSVIVAPMLWEGRGVGGIFVARDVVGPFSEKAIRLLKTFADQAAIAIQNARLFREIQEKSAQLEVANKHKSDFLANMSHELRTPLNAIIGFSEALMERMFGEVNEKQADYLKDIHESGRHLLSLINDILDLSKIEAGRMDLELSSFHLPTALSNAMTLIRERAQRHGIELGLEVDQQLGEFQADERKFKQIMLNLLSNAVKFTPDGGRVDVCAKKDTDKIEIAVKDTGIGIAPEDQAVVFEEFKQVGHDQMRKAEGTGLGLALTRRFVELHGGAIRLESTPGKGSTFTVSLPLRQ